MGEIQLKARGGRCNFGNHHVQTKKKSQESTDSCRLFAKATAAVVQCTNASTKIAAFAQCAQPA